MRHAVLYVFGIAVAIRVATASAAPGDLDLRFGSGGKVVTAIGSNADGAAALILQPDGKLVAAGYTEYDSTNAKNAFALVRYNSDGSLDGSFGTGGKVITPIGGYDDEASALVLQPSVPTRVRQRGGDSLL